MTGITNADAAPGRLTRKQALRLIGLAAAGAAAAPARAQEGGSSGHDMGGMMAEPDASPSTAAFEAAATRMHAAMAIDYTGDADIDFARGMIAHHQGAIDMAKVLLEYGSDPDLRQLAGEIIAAQEKEVIFLNQWLEAHGG